ncbi:MULTISPECIES: hypothetical protein [Rhizobium]|nr:MULTISPECIES: hypothetical protein [Rhizobium]MBB4416979.1 hypothetical protein [Rhizobium leguminosarum]MBB4430053.1 hypothetical protein [Rhizobium esperanzae]MBB4529799.1 hypothetical protein [Rhizobium leguminosarum]MBB5652288.1 hypothetical protein [Rhizobium leguminosarum]MBB5678953.1 hypothetical protein [Rhizobium leguminosarum]
MMASDLPTAYLDYADAFKFGIQRTADDLAWATANVSPVSEGPWGDVPSVQIFYIGINTAGERIRLPQISGLWRYKPSGVQLANSDDHDPDAPNQTYYLHGPGPGVVRIELGPSMPGILIERPKGSQPVQSTGLIDGKDFYFGESDGFWSLSVGGTDAVERPDWYYEEEHDAPDELSEMDVYSLIAKGAELLRNGTPTMAVEP